MNYKSKQLGTADVNSAIREATAQNHRVLEIVISEDIMRRAAMEQGKDSDVLLPTHINGIPVRVIKAENTIQIIYAPVADE